MNLLSSPVRPNALAAYSASILSAKSVKEKLLLAKDASDRWFNRTLRLSDPRGLHSMPIHPNFPDGMIATAPKNLKKRSYANTQGRLAHIHALAHIELNAVHLAFDMVGRFANIDLPKSFFDDWTRIGLEEAGHHEMLANRLRQLGMHYGELPVHNGLWEVAVHTQHDIFARLSLVPLVFEARGLDVTPTMIEKFNQYGDKETADILATIYNDEIRHVAAGMRWLNYLCKRSGRDTYNTFRQSVVSHFRGQIRGPFNIEARSKAGLSKNSI